MSSRDYRKKLLKKTNIKSILLSEISRRIFFIRTVQISILTTCLNSCSKLIGKTQQADHDKWQTINAVYDQLLPEDGHGPSAKQINATNYLKIIYESKKTSFYKKSTITQGEILLNKISRSLFSKNYVELSFDQKEKALRELEKKNLGERFLSLLIDMMFESLLGDPVYGAQPNFVGWQWLEHIPGFPRPEKANSRII